MMKSSSNKLVMNKVKMTMHAEQQTLIFDEMIATRKKLEIENQELRDDLSDAYLLIQVLDSKLQQATNRNKSTTGFPPFDETNIKNLQKKIMQNIKTQHRKSSMSRKQTFRNPLAAGKTMFAATASSTRSKSPRKTLRMKLKPENKPEQPKHQPKSLRRTSQVRPPSVLVFPSPQAIPVKPTTKHNPGPGRQENPNSIMNNLACMIINEYEYTLPRSGGLSSTDESSEDDDYLLFVDDQTM
jgi:hypothetical protein